MLPLLRETFGKRLEENVPLRRYTAARLGGPAEALLTVESAAELEQAVSLCWQHAFAYLILGGGSNVLVSDEGVSGLVILNQARKVQFDEQTDPPTVWAESGANFGVLARQAAKRGLAGLEWAAGIPGTLGGAIVGNAGAHGSDMADSLRLAEILHRVGDSTRSTGNSFASRHEEWTVDRLSYSYRSSLLKRQPGEAVVLAARLGLERSTPQLVQARLDEFTAYRKRTQPPGASLGSMFKNPPGDFAGRLIEAAGLKGARIGGAQISPVHANFFINTGNASAPASAADIYTLIQLARRTVLDKFGVELELEIECYGTFTGEEHSTSSNRLVNGEVR
jgi:UDP-N-acetylmuramate dehydrogenase